MGMGMEIVEQAISAPGVTAVHVESPPGCGKTYAAREAFLSMGFAPEHIYQITFSEDMVWQEALGHYVPGVDETHGTAIFEMEFGPIARALDHGALIVNELGRASTAILDAMLAVLDGDGVRRIDMVGGIRLEGHPNFKVIATSNSSVEDLDPALQDRFAANIVITHPSPGLVAHLNSRMDGLGTLIYNSFDDRDRAISPRKAMFWCDLRANMDEKLAAQLAFGPRGGDILNTIKGLR